MKKLFDRRDVFEYVPIDSAQVVDAIEQRRQAREAERIHDLRVHRDAVEEALGPLRSERRRANSTRTCGALSNSSCRGPTGLVVAARRCRRGNPKQRQQLSLPTKGLPTMPANNWADALNAYVADITARAKDAKAFYPPKGSGLDEVRGAISVVKNALAGLEALHRAN
jgi:hypothetical protein